MAEPGTQLDVVRTESGLRLAGEVDAHTAPQFDAGLTPLLDGQSVLRIDVSGVSFMDSSGLRIVISGTERQRSGGGDLVLVQPSELVSRLLSVSGLAEHLSISPAAE